MAAELWMLRHGDAVGLGLLCALDVGVSLGVTPRAIATEIDAVLPLGPRSRWRLARALRGASPGAIDRLLRSDKKRRAGGTLMILVARPGKWRSVPVAPSAWRRLLASWQRGVRPW